MILLTSTAEKNEAIKKQYPDLDFYSFPCIEYASPKDDYKLLDAGIRSNHLYEWVFFLSQKSAETFFDRLLAIGGNFFNLSNHLKFAVIGEATKNFLEKEVNMPVDFMPSKANSEAFIEEFTTKYRYDFECAFKVLLPRSELAQDDFKEKLEASKNYSVDIVPAYNTVLPIHSNEEIESLKSQTQKIKNIIFASSSCVRNFKKILPDFDINSVEIQSIGPKTSKTLKELYPEASNITEASEAKLNSIFEAIC